MNTPHLIESASYLKPFCKQWTNGLIASQYSQPIQMIEKYLPKEANQVVLDWGCGDGHFSHYLGNKGLDVHAYSFEPLGPIETFLRNKFGSNFQFKNPSNPDPVVLPYENETFDCAFSMGVLEHVRDTGGNELASLKELKRVLKPNGLLFICHFPNKFSWIEMTHRAAKKLKITNKYNHNWLYDRKDIEVLAEEGGFQVLESNLYNLFPRNIFRNVPDAFGNNSSLIKSLQLTEKGFSLVFKRFSQNHYAILRKVNKANV